jgi:hypothetical protein
MHCHKKFHLQKMAHLNGDRKMKPNLKISPVFFVFLWCFSSHAADMSLFDKCEGWYIGDISDSSLQDNNRPQHGGLKLNKHSGVLKISWYHEGNGKSKLLLPIKEELIRFFNEEAEKITLEDGTIEERVAFQTHNNKFYRFSKEKRFNQPLKEIWTYQFKFHNGRLVAFRMQEYNVTYKNDLLYIFELTKLKSKYNEIKSDWDF